MDEKESKTRWIKNVHKEFRGIHGQQKRVLESAQELFKDFLRSHDGGPSLGNEFDTANSMGEISFFAVPMYDDSICNVNHAQYDKNASIINQINIRKKMIDQLGSREEVQSRAPKFVDFFANSDGRKFKGVPVYYGKYGQAIQYMMRSDAYPAIEDKTDFRTKLDIMIYAEVRADADGQEIFSRLADWQICQRLSHIAQHVLYEMLRRHGGGVEPISPDDVDQNLLGSFIDSPDTRHAITSLILGKENAWKFACSRTGAAAPPRSSSPSPKTGILKYLVDTDDGAGAGRNGIKRTSDELLDELEWTKDELKKTSEELQDTRDAFEKTSEELQDMRDAFEKKSKELQEEKDAHEKTMTELQVDHGRSAKRRRTQVFVYTIKMVMALDTNHPKYNEIFEDFGLEMMVAYYVGMATTSDRRFSNLTNENLKNEHPSASKNIPEGFELRDVSVEHTLIENASDYVGGLEFTRYAAECRKQNDPVFEPKFVRGSCYAMSDNPYGKPHEKVSDVHLLRAIWDMEYKTGEERG